MHNHFLSLAAAIGLGVTATTAAASPDVQGLLDAGQFPEAIETLEQHLDDHPEDASARLALGVTTFLQGVEEFSQTAYRFGVKDLGRELDMMGPMFSLPIRVNPNPQEVSYDDVVGMFERFEDALEKVEEILEPIGDAEAHMPLRIGTVHMDLNGDGQIAGDEGLWRFYQALTNPRGNRWEPPQGIEAVEFEEDAPGFDFGEADAGAAGEFVLGLDTADAYWLRGYCHVMSGLTDVLLAHDGEELFNRVGHLVFEKPKTPYPWLEPNPADDNGYFNGSFILDMISGIHLINRPLDDADRMPQAHAHFMKVIEISRLSWSAILNETDNENEWVPGPTQQGVIGVNMTEQQVEAWLDFLDEAELILQGEKLLPFWRGGLEGLGSVHPTLGVNLKRVFTEPTPFDLILWIQGTAAGPYLEEGPRTEAGFWQNLNGQFGNNFPGFAVWIN